MSGIKRKGLGSTGETIPELGIGTWKMGSSPESEILSIRHALSIGMDLVDTAEMYANESLVGSAVKGRKAFVATKVSPGHFRHDDVISACDRSLERLGVECIDLYQLHWPNHGIPIKETMQAMEELADSGKIRHIGVSNFDTEELIEAQNSMEKYPIVSNQIEYSVFVRGAESELLDFCSDNAITVIAYSPLGQGALFDQRYRDTYELLERIGKPSGMTAPQVALAWVVSHKNVVAIPKAGSIRHVDEDAKSSGLKLSNEEFAEISEKAQEKRSIGQRFIPFLKKGGAWANALQYFQEKRGGFYRRSSTTRSSKK